MSLGLKRLKQRCVRNTVFITQFLRIYRLDSGLLPQNCHFHSKLKAGTIFVSMCLLGLTNRPEPVNYLDLIFTEFKKEIKLLLMQVSLSQIIATCSFVIEYCKSSPTPHYDTFYHKQRSRVLLFVVWFSFEIRFVVTAQCLLQVAVSLRCPSS